MTSKSQYEKKLDAFAPYLWRRESYWLADAIDMTTTTAAEGIVFFLTQIKYKWLLPQRFANFGEAEIEKVTGR